MPFILNVIFRLLSFIPARAMNALSYPLGALAWHLSPTKRNSTQKNLQACYPHLDAQQRHKLGRESMRHYIFTVLETGKAWHWSREKLCQQFDDPQGMQHLFEAMTCDAGVLALVPHFGAWEFSAQGFGDSGVTALYKPGDHKDFDDRLLKKRLRQGTAMAATNRSGLKKVYRQLSEGKLVLQLPDQDPSVGQGRFVSFFGVPAWTGILAPRLIQRTGCKVVFAACVRIGKGRYQMVFQPANESVYSPDIDESLAAYRYR